MGKVLSDEQIRRYREEGFVSPVDVMSEQEASEYLHRFEEAERRFPALAHAHKRNNVHLSFKCLDELAHHRVILDAVEDLIGAHFSLWATVLFCKEPQSPHYVSWHQDATYMGLDSIDFPTPWIALSPSNRDTGCMTMISGSHHSEIQIHKDTFGVHMLSSYRKEWMEKLDAEKYIQGKNSSIIVPSFEKCVSQNIVGYSFRQMRRWKNTRLNLW